MISRPGYASFASEAVERSIASSFRAYL